MLKELRIKNLAIIDDLKVRFEGGLNVLTGETGDGKSIIVDALSLALGSRAQSDLVRSGEKEAIVQAYFEVEGDNIPDLGIDISDGLILRRSISFAGKNRAYISDTMVNLQSLVEVGRYLVDIYGQHEHQSLTSIEKHRALLDSYGKLHDDRETVESLYSEVQALRREKDGLKQKVKERAHRLDLFRFQINEIDAASLRHGEKEALTEERTILSNLSRLKELTEMAYSILYGSEGSCTERLSSVIAKVREMSSIDQSVSETLNLLESALPFLEDAAISLRGFRDKYDLEPERLAEIEERLELVKRLERKYGEGIETILRYRDEAEKELKGLELSDERLDSIEAELNMKEDMLLRAALSLSEKRRKVAKRIEELVEKELEELAFRNAEFRIDIRQESITSNGLDRVEFMFSANPGEPPKPLIKIASGGELSRVMLALKGILADVDNIPILIFDEVDAGIGGRTAGVVGNKLKAISNRHQVLCTTHLPQIASLGDFHLKIDKRQRDERVYVEVKELTGRERLDEVARMLSGKITEVSLRHAQELLGSAA
ncbi:MAG: DNA repair protein RecN [Thermodesulfovibrionales bacterium]|nr:DNA repair protein RecN [Thermodesulfovibrionales bacterium]